MAYELSNNAIIEKNKLYSDVPYIIFIDFQYDTDSWLYLTNHPNIYEYWKEYNDTYEGDRSKLIYPYPSGTSYNYFPFDLSVYQEEDTGEIKDITLLLENNKPGLYFNPGYYFHNYELNYMDVIIREVPINLLDDNDAQLTNTFTIKGKPLLTQYNATLNLGHISGNTYTIGHRMSIDNCIYEFKGADGRCGYDGTNTTCIHILGDEETVNSCRYHGNSARFGACPNIRIK